MSSLAAIGEAELYIHHPYIVYGRIVADCCTSSYESTKRMASQVARTLCISPCIYRSNTTQRNALAD